MSMSIWIAKQSFHGNRAEFYEDLAEAIADGDPLAQRLEVLAERASGEGDMQAPLFRLWFDRMDDSSFSEALIGTVPDSDLMIIQAAEDSGDLVTGLEFTAKVIAATAIMRKTIRMAISGFVFLTIMQIALLAGFSFYGIELLDSIVPPNAWPWIGLQLKGLARFVTESGATTLGCFGVVAALYSWSLRNWYGSLRVAFDRYVPLYTIYRDFQGAMFLVSLAALMKNGVALNAALETLAERASPWLLWHIRQIQMRLDYESDSAGEAFDTGLFNRSLTWRIIDFGKRAGSDFAVAMEKVGIKSIDKVMDSVKARAAKLNRVLMFANAGMIMFIIGGVLGTVYEASEQLQKQINSSQSQIQQK
jgi:type II secretory pathway component PulF